MEWINVEEELPPQWCRVIVYVQVIPKDPVLNWIDTARIEKSYWVLDGRDYEYDYKVTHWTMFPERPKEE